MPEYVTTFGAHAHKAALWGALGPHFAFTPSEGVAIILAGFIAVVVVMVAGIGRAARGRRSS